MNQATRRGGLCSIQHSQKSTLGVSSSFRNQDRAVQTAEITQFFAIQCGGLLVQPLSYQLAEESCWIASMINGIRFVTDKDRIPTPVYRALHTLLQDDGVDYYTLKKKKLKAFDKTIEKVNNLAELSIYRCSGAEVENKLLDLQFNQCVAVCDIGDGTHSILLHNRTDDWFDGFDPFWYGRRRRGNQLLSFRKGKPPVNVRIHRRHLFAKQVDGRKYERGLEYKMGDIEHRFLTVIQK